MKIKFSYTLLEKIFFFGVMLFSIYPSLINTYNPTLDGPAHLYNSKLLTYYFSNPVVDQFFYINKTPSPNLFSHFFLSLFSLVFPANISEKIFIIFYFIFFPLSFRYFIKKYNPQSVFLSIIAIPLSHAALFYFGFYNFCISIPFMLVAIGFYYTTIYKKPNVSVKSYALIFILITLTYFSAVLSYVYLLAVIGLYELNTHIQFHKNGFKQHLKTRLLKNIVVVFPSLICLVIFYIKVKLPVDDTSIPITKLITNLLDFKSLMVYEIVTDAPYTKMLFILLIFLAAYCVAKNKYSIKDVVLKNYDTFIYLVLTAIIFIAYFIIPDGSNAGMMSERLSYLFMISLVLWIICQQNIRYPKIIGLLIIIPHYFLFQQHSNKQKALSETALAIVKSGKYVKENSVVLPINLAANWIFTMDHFPNYLGINKSLIILENYEARMAWFPLNWDYKTMPLLTLNNKKIINNVEWPMSKNAQLQKEIDYVYVLGDLNEVKSQEKWIELSTNIDSAYTLSYEDKKNNIYLFKHK